MLGSSVPVLTCMAKDKALTAVKALQEGQGQQQLHGGGAGGGGAAGTAGVGSVPPWHCSAGNAHKPLAGAVLVDDNADAREAWEQHGGVFVHHTSTPTTIGVLQSIGY
jgi:hypothetical protein